MFKSRYLINSALFDTFNDAKHRFKNGSQKKLNFLKRNICKKHTRRDLSMSNMHTKKKEDHSSGLLNFTYTSQNDNNSLVHKRFL